jgi:hypothetical protein
MRARINKSTVAPIDPPRRRGQHAHRRSLADLHSTKRSHMRVIRHREGGLEGYGVIPGALLVLALGWPAASFAQPANCMTFSESPQTAGVTVIRAAHFTELRSCINALRETRGLAPAVWTDPTLVPGETVVRSVHLTELRTALSAVFVASALTPPDFGVGPIAGTTEIRAAHLIAIRDAIASVPVCTYAVDPQLTNVSGTANDVIIAVTTGVGCVWTPFEESEFASFTSTAMMSGSSTATLHVVANEALVPRTITAVVAGTYVTVIQGRAPCTFQVSPGSANVSAAASSVVFSVTTNQCDWTALESSSFAAFSTAEGSGNGLTTLYLDANPTTQARTVDATIGGVAVSVTQAGLTCTYQVTPNSEQYLPSAAATVVFNISTQAPCSWTAVEDTEFSAFTSSSGVGAGSTSLLLAENTSPSLIRTLQVTVAGTQVTVNQGRATTPTSSIQLVQPAAVPPGQGDLILGLYCNGEVTAPYLTYPIDMRLTIYVDGQDIRTQVFNGVGGISSFITADVRASVSDRVAECRLQSAIGGNKSAFFTIPGAGPGSVTLKIAAFIPEEFQVAPWSSEESIRLVGGDERGFQYTGGDSRIVQIFEVLNPAVNNDTVLSGPHSYPGMSMEYEFDTSIQPGSDPLRLRQEAKDDWEPGPPMKLTWGFADVSDVYCDAPQRLSQEYGFLTSSLLIHCKAAARYPFHFLAPDIDYDYTVRLTFYNNGFDYVVSGCHDDFPSQELYLNGHTVLNDPHGSVFGIFPPCDEFPTKTGSVR